MKHLFRVLTLVLCKACLTSGTANITGGLSFDCAQNGSMLIFGTKAASYGSVYATQTIGTNNDTKCTSFRHGDDHNVIFEIKGCNISFPIKAMLMREKQNSTYGAVVVGGKDLAFYNLTCNNIPIGGFSFQKTLNLTESEQVTYTPYMESTLNVQMEVLNNGSIIANKPIPIGTALKLSISCEVGFNVFLEICIATDFSHKYNKTLLLKGASMDMDLISNFTENNAPTVLPMAPSTSAIPRHSTEATLYAFHFAGSNSIEIVCNITVCQSDDSSCPSNHVSTPNILTPSSRSSITGSTPATSSTIKPSPPNSARRKRNIPDGPRTETLRTDLWVVDTITDNVNGMKVSGTSKGPPIWMCLVGLAASVACSLM